MQLRAIGLQLRLVGDGADQRMPERVLGMRAECRLVDELRGDEISQSGRQSPAPSSISGVKRDPITAAAFRVRLAAGSRRSMRAAITACSVRGTWTSAAGTDAQVAAAAADQHVALAQIPDDLLGEEGIARRPLCDRDSASSATDLSLAEQLGTRAPASASRPAARAQSFVTGAHAQVRQCIPAGR